MFKIRITLTLVVILLGLSCAQQGTTTNEPPLFVALEAKTTGIDFSNTLTEGLNTNILVYEYFYNGGGVATGDLNGDGLLDLYFTANMESNQLYLNQGDFKFNKVTDVAGVAGRPGPWKTGVTIVDINNDQKLDIYICYSGALPAEKRTNQLFINQGNNGDNIPQFKEQAAEYGLASAGYSNQGYFLDYDRDGDLDMLLLNHNPKALPRLNEIQAMEFMKTDDPESGLRLFQQDQGKFVDVTQTTGIIGAGLSYGLGLGIADINNDGWPDFYVSNDYDVPDYLYINNQKGGFTNQLKESVRHNSKFSMGNDLGDINNDGLADIFTLDMLPEDNRRQKLLKSPDNYAKFDLNLRSGFHYQYMRNMLQVNNGNGTFSELGQFAGISNTDWSWAALLADYNNDGWKDLYITNGYLRDFTNLDFIDYMDNYVNVKGRLHRTDVMDIIAKMPASNVENYLYINQGGLQFENKTKDWGVAKASNSNGAVYADLDNDGDLDLVVNNINQPAFIYRNESDQLNDHHFLKVKLKGPQQNAMGLGAKVTLYAGGQQQNLEHYTCRGYLSTVSPILHIGLGQTTTIDSLVVVWPNGSKETQINLAVDQEITLDIANANNDWQATSALATIFESVKAPIPYQALNSRRNDFDRQLMLIQGYSHNGPPMASADLNGDGRADVIIGGANGQPAVLFYQSPSGKFGPENIYLFEEDSKSHDTDIAIFDANGDGKPDIYITSGGYHLFHPKDPVLQDRLYLNDGAGGFTKSAQGLPKMIVSTSCVTVQDINGDGALDLFAGGQVIPGHYPITPRSYLLINDGQGKFTDQTAELGPDLEEVGLVCDAQWADLDGDQQAELVVVGEWMPIEIYKNEGGKLIESADQFLEENYQGWWNTIELADYNNDQKLDILVGNFGTNTQFKVSPEEPAELIYKDFDKNGAVDPIFCYYIQGKSYPYLTRNEILRQLAGLRSRFTTYESYADATIEDIFLPVELEDTDKLEADRMETSLFLSNATGKRSLAKLPDPVQFSSVNAITTLDFNEDGKLDVLLCGNNADNKLSLGKSDANYGVLLQGDGKGGFTYIDQRKSGFQLKGDVRSILQMEDILLFGINRGPLEAYSLSKNLQ